MMRAARPAATIIALAFLLNAPQAHAAYKARMLVEPGPLFNAAPVVAGNSGYVKVRSDVKPEDVSAHLAAPGGLATIKTSAGEKVYVADVLTLREVDAETGAIKNVLPLMEADFYPTTVSAAYGNTRLLVGSWISGRVRLIDPASGEVLRNEQNLDEPYDAVVMPDGSWIVAEAGAKQLTVITPDGNRLAWATGFERPVGLALGPNNTLFVVDRTAGTLTAIDLINQQRRVLVKDLDAPEGVVVLGDGNVAVLATGSRDAYSYDPATGEKKDRIATNFALGDTTRTFFAPTLGKPADARLFNGLALGADGTIYVGSDIQTVLYALKVGGGPKSFMDMIRGLTSKVFR